MLNNSLIVRHFFYILCIYKKKKNIHNMVATLLLQVKVFLFIMAIFTVIIDIFHVVSVFRLKSGKLASREGLIVFGVSLSYILTMLICGF